MVNLDGFSREATFDLSTVRSIAEWNSVGVRLRSGGGHLVADLPVDAATGVGAHPGDGEGDGILIGG